MLSVVFHLIFVQNILEMECKEGDTVELSSDNEGRFEAWYTAKVESNGKNLVVEYKKLGNR